MADALTDREQALWRAVTLMTRELGAAVEQRLQGEAGISAPDFEILHALSAAPSHQARAGELAEMLSWEKSRISHHVTRMVTRGLVERTHCETDLRGTWVALAPAGQEALAKAAPVHADEVRKRFLGVLESDESLALAYSALKVIEATDRGACDAVISEVRERLAPVATP